MKLDTRVFRSKLAWRFFSLFVICALVPIVTLALVTYAQVGGQLKAQAYERLHAAAKSFGLSVYEHLALAESQMQLLRGVILQNAIVDPAAADVLKNDRNQHLFSGLGVYRRDDFQIFWGPEIPGGVLRAVLEQPWGARQSMLLTFGRRDRFQNVVLVQSLAANSEPQTFLVACLNPDYLWGLGSGTILPAQTHWCVADDQGRALFSSLRYSQLPAIDPGDVAENGSAQRTVLNIGPTPYYAGSWLLFLKPRYHLPSWTVAVLEPENYVLSPFHHFRFFFPLFTLMSAALVVLLSSLAIRRSLIPIDALMHAARKVAHRQFDHRVEVRSRDEFQDLAEAFNRMADQLDKHIKALVARSDLDRAILSLLDTEQIIDTILRHLQVYFPCQTGAISVLDPETANQGRTYYHSNVADATLRADPFLLDPALQKQLSCGAPWLRIDRPEGPWQFLQEVRPPQADHFVVLPVVINGRLTALVSLVVGQQTEYTPADLEQAGQLVHHLAVAISNADLIRELKALNMGTLNALARTVDAKSPWTAGHSERVMQVALRIGDAMGLSAEQLFDIRRAALLHDIGKIGVPARILDKTDTLTSEEYQIIKTHPSSGARILKPIAAYQKLIPYVEQHHERYDAGVIPKGWPQNRSSRPRASSPWRMPLMP